MLRSVAMLKTGKVAYEFRTTVVPDLVTSEDVKRIGDLVRGAKTHAFQQFVPKDLLDKKYELLSPYSPDKIGEFAEDMKRYAENVVTRV